MANHTPPSSRSQSSGSISYPAGEASSVRTSLLNDSGAPLLASNDITTLTGLENFEAWFMSLETALRSTDCWEIWRRRELSDLEFIATSRSTRARSKVMIVKAELFHTRLRVIIDLVLGTIDPGVRRYINEPKTATFWTVDNVHDIIIDLFFLLLLEDAIARRPVGEMAQFSASSTLSALSQHTRVGRAMPLEGVMAQMQDLEERVPDSLKRLVRRRKADLSKHVDKARSTDS